MATPAIIQLVETLGEQNLPTAESVKQYDPLQHDIFDRGKRKKRRVTVPTGEFEKDANGQIVKDASGNPIPKVKTTWEEVNRTAVAMQQLIVQRRAAFINAGNMNIVCKTTNPAEETLLEMVKKCIFDNKVQFKLTEIAERKMSELQVAMLWYSEDVGPEYWKAVASGTKRMRMKVLAPTLGDRLLPVFDGNGKMTYFARGYKATRDLTDLINLEDIDDIALPSDLNTEVEHLDIYSDKYVYKFEMEKGVWVPKERITHTYGGLPVIYFSQPRPEWFAVQHIIERIETLISNFGDTNDANGWPILMAKGIIRSMPARGETGKVINIVSQIGKDGKEVGDADLRYVSWDRAPDAIKLELETHMNNVFSLTDTPDISTKGMAELGLQSGVAFDRVFMGAHLGAMRHTHGNFGEGAQRMINFLKKACIAINTSVKSAAGLEITAEFPLFRINDESETVNMLLAATGGEPLLSRQTAVGLAGLVQDPEAENKLIDKQQDTLGDDINADQNQPEPDK